MRFCRPAWFWMIYAIWMVAIGAVLLVSVPLALFHLSGADIDPGLLPEGPGDMLGLRVRIILVTIAMIVIPLTLVLYGMLKIGSLDPVRCIETTPRYVFVEHIFRKREKLEGITVVEVRKELFGTMIHIHHDRGEISFNPSFDDLGFIFELERRGAVLKDTDLLVPEEESPPESQQQ